MRSMTPATSCSILATLIAAATLAAAGPAALSLNTQALAALCLFAAGGFVVGRFVSSETWDESPIEYMRDGVFAVFFPTLSVMMWFVTATQANPDIDPTSHALLVALGIAATLAVSIYVGRKMPKLLGVGTAALFSCAVAFPATAIFATLITASIATH